MVAQQKILRVFKLIQLLKGTRKRTAVEISEMMEISKRTFYRYLNLLEELGFEVELDFEGRYFIPTNEGDEIDFTFNSEESILIREALQTAASGHNMKDGVLKKLHMFSEQAKLGDNILDAGNSLKIQKLVEAINLKLRVRLERYSSVNSAKIKDRIVEPIRFTDNYEHIIAIDTDDVDQGEKHFKIKRIEAVSLIEQDQKYTEKINEVGVDVFGYSGNESYRVVLQLKHKSYTYFKEMYPRAQLFLKRSQVKNEYTFTGEAYKLEPVARFVLSYMDCTVVDEPQELKSLLNEFLHKQQSF
mgnify:CR=1 FL=1